MVKLSGAIRTLVFAASAFLALALWGRSQRTEGELRQRIAAREKVIAVLAKQAHAADTAYVTDTLRLTKWRTSYSALRDTIQDTIWFPDTSAAHRFLRLADSTIVACTLALRTCEQRVAARDTIIWQKDSLIRDLKKRHGFRLFGFIPLACTAGADVLHARPGLTCGVPVLR